MKISIIDLRKLTGSSSAAILMFQLEYWFFIYRDGFSKYLETPSNPDYSHSSLVNKESWTEELSFGKDEFRAAFDLIGTRFNSKTQYEKAVQSGDEFKDKFYLSYFDRRTGLTYYLRNHDKLDPLAMKLAIAASTKY
jgi:hypothetical protein